MTTRSQTPNMSQTVRPDARLVLLHAERGDPATRLASALADLENADWGLLFSGQEALARQMAALLGPGTLRVDGRLNLNRRAFAEAGLAVADLHGDFAHARAAWLLEPDEQTIQRAQRAGIRVIVDGTLAPGGGWPERGADYVVYTDSVTLTGYDDAPLSALFGLGDAPNAIAAAPTDLSVALALREVATLPLRLARAARTVSNLQDRLGAAARPVTPTALLLAPDAAADTISELGGVLAAARHIPEGVLLTPGLEDTDAVLRLLRDHQDTPSEQGQTEQFRAEQGRSEQGRTEQSRERREERPRDERTRDDRNRDERSRRPERDDRRDADRRDADRRDRPRRFEGQQRFENQRFERQRPDGQPGEQRREGRGQMFRPAPPRPDIARPDSARPDMARPDFARPDFAHPDVQASHLQAAPTKQNTEQNDAPERFVFEAPTSTPKPVQVPAQIPAQIPAVSGATEEVWEPEIVYSDLEHTPPPLTHTVSSGPDAPELLPAELPTELADELPEVLEQALELSEAPEQPSVPAPDSAPIIAPDLPALPTTPKAGPEKAGKDDLIADLSDEQAAIYARLRTWRNAEAKRQSMSTFIVASNASLAEIARRVPYTLDDLRQVKGMGPARLEKYGEQILDVVRG